MKINIQKQQVGSMNLDELTYGQNEDGIHLFLKNRGFTTNFKKTPNKNGVDIVAIKDVCF